MKRIKLFEEFISEQSNAQNESVVTEAKLKISGNAYDIWNDKDIQSKLRNIKFKIDGDWKGTMTLRGDESELAKIKDIFGLDESVISEGMSKDRMIKQIKRALKDGTSIFKLPMDTQKYYYKNKSDFESDVSEEAIEVTPDSKVVVDDYLLDDAETEIKSTEIIGAIVSANSEDEFLDHFYKEYGNGAFTETDIAKLIAYYQDYREEVNAAETEAEEEAEAGDEKDPLANLDI